MEIREQVAKIAQPCAMSGTEIGGSILHALGTRCSVFDIALTFHTILGTGVEQTCTAVQMRSDVWF
eukprot:2160332-Rhodomonas_salina.2